MRKIIIAGNWKMNKTIAEAEELVSGIVKEIRNLESRIQNVEIVLCPPFTALYRVSEILKGSNIKLGAQNLHYEEKGAYTGEISAGQLIDVGCKYVIVGHSERRQYFEETDEIVNKKVKLALKSGLSPILCVGETEKERREGKEKEVVERQLQLVLKDTSYSSLVIAYEPVWAIGTGNTCNPEDADSMHRFIRSVLEKEDITILYGGSVNPDNIDSIMKMPNIDGTLVGGASLDVSSFCRIVEFR
ncbi:TPA: triose-phosphate isomerase [bacterium]|nr:triose-phosphate isomerase [bacterium]